MSTRDAASPKTDMRTIVFSLSLLAALAAAPAEARKNCPKGYHPNKHGVCVINKKGREPVAVMVPRGVTGPAAPVPPSAPCPAGYHPGPNGNCTSN